jgi:hypothetical protein
VLIMHGLSAYPPPPPPLPVEGGGSSLHKEEDLLLGAIKTGGQKTAMDTGESRQSVWDSAPQPWSIRD